MPRVYSPKPGYKRLFNYSKTDLDAAVACVENGMSQRKASRQFNIPRGTLQNRVCGRFQGKHGGQTVLSEAEEKAFAEHLLTLANWGFPVNFLDFRLLVKNYLEKCNRNVAKFCNNLPSDDWVRSFIKRHKTVLSLRFCQNIATKRADVSPQTIKEYFKNLEETMNNGGDSILPENILNFDETNLSDNPGKKRCIFRRGVKYPERVLNSTKASTSLMFACIAAGRMLPPYVVYKSKHLMNTWMEGGPPFCRYNRSKSGWFDSVCFSDWFNKIVLPWAKSTEGKKVVIGDNLSSHFTEESIKLCLENDISFACLPPNSTHLCQPLDVSVFSSLKKNWRDVLTEWKKGPGRRFTTLPKDEFPKLLNKLMNRIDPVVATNIISGFRKTGIYPVNAMQVLNQLPQDDGTEENLSTISAVFINSLKEIRYDQLTPKPRRKRVAVEPGKSVSLEDVLSNSPPLKKVYVCENPTASTNTSDETCEEEDVSDDNSEQSEGNVSDHEQCFEIKEGRWVIVKYLVRNRSLHYVGRITKEIVDSDSDSSSPSENQTQWEVTFLRKSNKSSAFIPPRVEDIAVVYESDIVRVLPEPQISKRKHHLFDIQFHGFNIQ